MLIRIARASLWNRRFAAALTIATIAISVALLLAVERIRNETRASFASTISGTDLIVGARTGPVQLLLYSVFRIGDATNNIRWDSYQQIAAHPQVAWTIPLSLGDSHRGHRVVGTTTAYFEHYRYGGGRPLAFRAGRAFAAPLEAVIGAEVARKLGYAIDQEIVIAHGTGRADITTHDDHPFRIVGILAPTGTPVDRSVHVSLEGIELIHVGWQSGTRRTGSTSAAATDLTPETVTAVLIGLKSRMAAFSMQRQINQYEGEALLAIMPGITLAQLWSLVGVAEGALLLVAACVVVAGLLGMLTALLTTLNERRREMAILRSVGARPWQIGALLVIESTLLTLLGALAGLAVVVLGMLLLSPWLAEQYGLYLRPLAFTLREAGLVAIVLCGGIVAGMIPAWLAYTRSLADGLTPRT
jgi:putative ABC transport system permease protein